MVVLHKGVLFSINNQSLKFFSHSSSIVARSDRSNEGGYLIEAALPWTILGVSATSGDEYGFVISVSDNDSEGVAIQESMVSNSAARDLSDPNTWGRIKLVR